MTDDVLTHWKSNAHNDRDHGYDIKVDIPKHHEATDLNGDTGKVYHKHNTGIDVGDEDKCDQKNHDCADGNCL